MRGFWPILGVVLTSALWGIGGLWEWTVPEGIEQRISEWKRKWYWSQVIIRVMSDVPIEELEQFAWSLRWALPKLQRELGIPVALEIEWKAPELLVDPAECCISSTSDQNQVQDRNGPDGFEMVRQGSNENGDEKSSNINYEEIKSQRDLYFSCLNRHFPELFWMRQAE